MTIDTIYGISIGRITAVLLSDGRWYACEQGDFAIAADENVQAPPSVYFVIFDRNRSYAGALSAIVAVEAAP